MKYIYGLIAIALLVGATAWAAHGRGYDDGHADGLAENSKAIVGLKADVAQANAERDAANVSLSSVRQLLNQQRESMEAHAALFTALLDNRDQLQKQLSDLARKRQTNVVKVGHEDPQCADLARMPVCPAVDQRLWHAAGDRVPATATH